MRWPNSNWPGLNGVDASITYVYGINGETRGYIQNSVTTLYDANVITYNPGVKTWMPIAGASASTGWITDESSIVICNTLTTHPYAVNDKFCVPYYNMGISTSSGSPLPTGLYTILTTPTSTSFTMTPDAGYSILTTGAGSFNGTSAFNIHRVMLPYGMLQTGDTLEVSGSYYVAGAGSKTIEAWINDANSKMFTTSTSTNGTGQTLTFSGSINIGTDSITGLISSYYYLSNEVDNWFILIKASKVTAADSLALVDLTINLLRP